MNPTRQLLPDGRWHFAHGPIDLLIAAEGDAAAVQAAHEAAWGTFQPLLAALVAELPRLRQPVAVHDTPPRGPVARAMWQACRVHLPAFVTPMAAVAGAVADAVIAAYRRPGVRRAWVNNGGDIALHLGPGTSVQVGLVVEDHPAAHRRPTVAPPRDGLDVRPDARFAVDAAMPVRGIATSGWGGRSFSLGIADAVTVLARDAATADAAATMVANAVDVDDPRIRRRPAAELKDDSDLGDRLVTVEVPSLPAHAVASALAAGLARAAALQRRGLVFAASLACQQRLAVLPPVGVSPSVGLSPLAAPSTPTAWAAFPQAAAA